MPDVARMVEQYRQARSDLKLLDANLWLGRPRPPEFVTSFGLAALQQRMARYQITGGVVSHFAALSYGPQWANAQLLACLAGTGLWATVALLPEMFYDEERGRAYLAQAIAGGARLARVFPRSHNFSLRAWCSGRLLHALEASRLPLVVWHTEATWDDIRQVCEAFPHLPVVVEGTPLKILYYDRLFYPLLEQCPNLRLELHNLVNYLGIEDLVHRFGAGRLIFGSNLPVYDPNATIMQISHARVSSAEKALMAHQNLAGLIAGVKQP